MASIEAERRVRERYLGEETGLRPAVFESIRRLYSLPRLPANPYFFVATQLSAHSAHSANSVWAVRRIFPLHHTSDTRRGSSGAIERVERIARFSSSALSSCACDASEQQQKRFFFLFCFSPASNNKPTTSLKLSTYGGIHKPRVRKLKSPSRGRGLIVIVVIILFFPTRWRIPYRLSRRNPLTSSRVPPPSPSFPRVHFVSSLSLSLSLFLSLSSACSPFVFF